jgi:hypothetical protein
VGLSKRDLTSPTSPGIRALVKTSLSKRASNEPKLASLPVSTRMEFLLLRNQLESTNT